MPGYRSYDGGRGERAALLRGLTSETRTTERRQIVVGLIPGRYDRCRQWSGRAWRASSLSSSTSSVFTRSVLSPSDLLLDDHARCQSISERREARV